jgi:hypothetical protein
MSKGRVEQLGTPLDIYNRPATRFVAGFFGTPTMNFIEGVVEAGPAGAHFRGPGLAAACQRLQRSKRMRHRSGCPLGARHHRWSNRNPRHGSPVGGFRRRNAGPFRCRRGPITCRQGCPWLSARARGTLEVPFSTGAMPSLRLGKWPTPRLICAPKARTRCALY